MTEAALSTDPDAALGKLTVEDVSWIGPCRMTFPYNHSPHPIPGYLVFSADSGTARFPFQDVENPSLPVRIDLFPVLHPFHPVSIGYTPQLFTCLCPLYVA
jgi:hypothetical protein